MSHWIAVTHVDALAEGAMEVVDLPDGRAVAVARTAEGLRAFLDECSHEALPLSDGEIEGDEIVCPYHAARFCLKSGAATAPPAYEAIPIFTVREVDGVVEVDADSA